MEKSLNVVATNNLFPEPFLDELELKDSNACRNVHKRFYPYFVTHVYLALNKMKVSNVFKKVIRRANRYHV